MSVDDFERLGFRGRGNSSVVFAARRTGCHLPVALKVLDPERAHDPLRLGEFEQEAAILQRLGGRNGIPELFHYVRPPDSQTPMLAMELADFSVDQVLVACGRIHPQAAAGIIKCVADTVGYLARNGVVHRDLKSENLLLMPASAEVLLADFGRAYLRGTTPDGALYGDPRSVAPENLWLLEYNEFEPALDSELYSLAALFFELCTGVALTAIAVEVPGEVVARNRLRSPAHRRRRYAEVVPSLRTAIAAAIGTLRQFDDSSAWQQLVDLVSNFASPEPTERRSGTFLDALRHLRSTADDVAGTSWFSCVDLPSPEARPSAASGPQDGKPGFVLAGEANTEKYPESSIAWLRLGQALQVAGMPTEARRAYTRAGRLDNLWCQPLSGHSAVGDTYY